MSQAVFWVRHKDGFETLDEDGALFSPAPRDLYGRLNQRRKPWLFSSNQKKGWSGFWPVLVDRQLAACYGLGRVTGGKKLGKDEKTLMELLADRTACFLKEKQIWRHLEAANRQSSLGLMSAAMIHEIRNPLTALSTLVQLLPQKKDDEKFMESFQKLMLQEINRLTRLTETFLNFSKSVKGQSSLVDLGRVVEQAVQLLNPLFATKKVRLNAPVAKGMVLKGDESQIESLVLNLLQNAFQSVGNHGVVEVSIKLFSRFSAGPGPWIELRVKDNGRGISKAELSKIFTPFFSTRESGTGLGLAICQKVVQNHGAYLKVVGQVKKGAIFSVIFPAVKNQPPLIP